MVMVAESGAFCLSPERRSTLTCYCIGNT